MENPYLAPEDDEEQGSPDLIQTSNPYVRSAAAQRNPYLEVPESPKPDMVDSTLNPDAGPGFGEVILDSAARGAARGMEKITDFYEGMRRTFNGQPFFHVPEHEAKASPEVENLLNTPIEQGWSSPKWWTAKTVNAVTESWPEFLSAAPGAIVAGMPGAIGSTAIGTGFLSLIPAFKDAKARGLDDEAAVAEAAKIAAINGGTAALAGVAGAQGFTGMIPQVINGKAAQALKHPIREAFVQLGLIQPGIQAVSQIAQGVVGQGRKLEDIGPWELAEGVGLSVLSQSPFTGLQIAMMRPTRGRPRLPLREVGPAEPEPVAIPVRDVAPGPVERLPGEMPELGTSEEAAPIFFSQVRRIIDEKAPERMQGRSWENFLKRYGAKDEELDVLQIPQWLAGQKGQVSKADLIAHVEEKQVHIVEKQLEEVKPPPLQWTTNEQGTLTTPDGYIVRRMSDGRYMMETPWGDTRITRNIERGQALAQEEFDYEFQRTNRGGVQYGNYVLGGPKEGSWEILFTLPRADVTELQTQIDALNRQFSAMTTWDTPEARALEVQMNALQRQYNAKTQREFESAHFGEHGRNLLAHLRITSRMDRDGKRTLFIEEIQSDWHQKGRKHGYVTEGLQKRKELAAELREVEYQMFGRGEGAPELVERAAALRRELFPGEWTAEQIRFGSGQYDNDWAVFRNRELVTEIYGMRTAEGAIREAQDQTFQRSDAAPDAPFKSSWEELMFKRALRYAADNGFERIAWTNGDQQVQRYPGVDEKQSKGLREFYGTPEKRGVLDGIAFKWARKLGVSSGSTQMHIPETVRHIPIRDATQRAVRGSSMDSVRYIDVSPAAASHIQKGLPFFEKRVQDLKITAGQAPIDEPAGLRAVVRQAVKVLERVRQKMGLEGTDLREVEIINDPTLNSLGFYNEDLKRIRINLAHANSAEAIYTTLSHEFGHHLQKEVFDAQSPEVKLQIIADYEKFLQQLRTNPTVAEALPSRRSPVSEFHDPSSNFGMRRFMDLTQAERDYWFGFNEWFADNVARWATTDKKPMSLVDKFFASLGQRIRDVIKEVRKIFGGKQSFEAAPAMRDWLNSFMKDSDLFGPEVGTHAHLQGLLKNAEALDREGTEAPPYPMTGSTGGGRAIVEGAGAGDAGRAAAAHADRMTWFHRVALTLQQIARENRHILPLQLYKELVDLQNLDVMTSLNQADSNVLRPWKHLNEKEGIALGKVIDDYANGRFMDPKELVKSGLRRPTADELLALMRKHGLGVDGANQFHAIIKDLQKDLLRYRDILLAETARIKDPIEQAQAMERVEAQIRAMDSVPFMPFARFGDYTLTIYSKDGKVKEFYRFESGKKRDKEVARLAPIHKLLGEDVRAGFLHKDVHPLLGMPPGMLDRIADKLNLSQNMRDAIDQLKFEYAPAQSFRHHFQQKDFTPGYSKDWQRAYAQYKFHGAHYFARIKYADQMREMIRAMTDERFKRTDHTKLDQIRNFMTEHLDTVLNPKADWATFKGIMFHFHMGFRVATAAINLTQVPMVAWPNLASHFGDVKSAAALIRASTRMNTYYRRSTIEHMTGDEIRVMQQAMDDGLVSPKQAFEIAGLSENRNLFKGLGKGVETVWQQGTEISAKMFELSEQWGRRVTLMGAYDLAKKNLNAPFVKDSINANLLLYLKLREKHWSHEEAAAYTAAKASVDESMFEYGYHARPKMFQGAIGAALIFKSFQQNVLFNMWSNKGSMIRQLLLLGGAAGMMGLPFSEDLLGIMKMLSKHFLSKDFDLEDEVRKQVRDISEGTISPDLILHGVGRYAFGIPHALAAMGRLTGLGGEEQYGGPFPQPMGPSVSRSIGMGNVLPFEPGRAFTPAKNQAQQELQQIQRASGAGFGLGFALYNFAMSNPFTDPDRKKWEPILPAAIRDVSQAWRFSSLPGGEGGERNRQGNQIIRFDPYDTLGMAEILQRATGFQPTRLVARHENIAAKAEAEAFWDIRRQLLMRQFWSAVRDQNSEQRSDVLEAIRNFNRGLPPEARGKAITNTSLRQSIERRAQERARTERGLPTNPRNFGLYREIDSLYPEGAPAGLQDVRRVR